jgi:NAD(P)-dependent dehydrogenase (short-subunit alcohol dehydrogenase family)
VAEIVTHKGKTGATVDLEWAAARRGRSTNAAASGTWAAEAIPMKTWFLTGTSKGFGRLWAEAALERGDQVVATARDVTSLEPLAKKFGARVLCLALDVTDREAVFEAVRQALARFGALDVVVNNAGFGLFGMIEEITEAEARRQMDTNLFGALWVTQAVLPRMRERRSGHILQVSSIGGVQAFPGLGLYHASKWALEGFSQSLHDEVKAFGIHVTLIEPTGYATEWSGPSAVRAAPMKEYDAVRDERARARAASFGKAGQPEATARVVLELVDMSGPPLRLFLGDGPLEWMKTEYASRIAVWEKYARLSHEAHGG